MVVRKIEIPEVASSLLQALFIPKVKEFKDRLDWQQNQSQEQAINSGPVSVSSSSNSSSFCKKQKNLNPSVLNSFDSESDFSESVSDDEDTKISKSPQQQQNTNCSTHTAKPKPKAQPMVASDAETKMTMEIDLDLADTLVQAQNEIAKVKSVLMTPGETHYGMDGSLLQEYLLQLIKKEVSLLQIVAKNNTSGGQTQISNGTWTAMIKGSWWQWNGHWSQSQTNLNRSPDDSSNFQQNKNNLQGENGLIKDDAEEIKNFQAQWREYNEKQQWITKSKSKESIAENGQASQHSNSWEVKQSWQSTQIIQWQQTQQNAVTNGNGATATGKPIKKKRVLKSKSGPGQSNASPNDTLNAPQNKGTKSAPLNQSQNQQHNNADLTSENLKNKLQNTNRISNGPPRSPSSQSISSSVAPNVSEDLSDLPKLDKENLDSVIKYLIEVVNRARKGVGKRDELWNLLWRALRALAGLVYKVQNARQALRSDVLPLLNIISDLFGEYGNGAIAGYIAGTVCNLAYDQVSCTQLFSASGIRALVDVLDGMSLFPNHSYLHNKGSEAFARVLLDDENQESDIKSLKEILKNNPELWDLLDEEALQRVQDKGYYFMGALINTKRRSWTSVSGQNQKDEKQQQSKNMEETFAHMKFVETLIWNEAIDQEFIAKELLRHMEQLTDSVVEGSFEIVGCCSIISAMCNQQDYGNDFAALLRDRGTISIFLKFMQNRDLPSPAARASIECVARIIATSIEGLELFVKFGGIEVFQELMDRHLQDKVLQARAIRALASGQDWPLDLQKLAQFDCPTLLRRTLNAVRSHPNDAWLLLAGFEGFYKFLPGVNEKIKSGEIRDGTEAMVAVQDLIYQVQSAVNEVMKSRFPDDGKLNAWGARILELCHV